MRRPDCQVVQHRIGHSSCPSGTVPVQDMLTEYRRRFIDYRSTSTEMALLCRKGLRRATESLAIFREHRDLFSVGMIGQLRDYLKVQGEGGTGERELIGARRLLGFSIEGRLTSAALEIDEELARQSVDPRVIDAPGCLTISMVNSWNCTGGRRRSLVMPICSTCERSWMGSTMLAWSGWRVACLS